MPTTYHVIITLVIIQDYYTKATKEIEISSDITSAYTEEEMTVEDITAEVDAVLYYHGLHEFPTKRMEYKVFNDKGKEIIFWKGEEVIF